LVGKANKEPRRWKEGGNEAGTKEEQQGKVLVFLFLFGLLVFG
jgi:hypothetical protein